MDDRMHDLQLPLQGKVILLSADSDAVLDLPGSLEAGTSVAQESLESVDQAIDDIGGTVWRGTAEIISQGKVVLLSADSDASLSDPGDPAAVSSSKRYNRFDAQVLAIQSDPASFSEEPEDAEDYRKWRLGFDLVVKEDEIEIMCYENSTLEGLFEKLVPGTVDFDTFWSRYYYMVLVFMRGLSVWWRVTMAYRGERWSSMKRILYVMCIRGVMEVMLCDVLVGELWTPRSSPMRLSQYTEKQRYAHWAILIQQRRITAIRKTSMQARVVYRVSNRPGFHC